MKGVKGVNGTGRREFVGLLGTGMLAAAGASCRRSSSSEGPGGQGAQGPQAAAAPGSPAEAAPPAAPAEPPPVFPEKVSDLILHTDRPPNLETPLRYFAEDLTPNDAFFVRWHLEQLPTTIDTSLFRLTVRGHVERPLSLSLDDLSKLPPVEVVAVNQCSGNSRALFAPHVPGVQWVRGAMGNARWRGARLKDLLEKAGVKKGAVDVVFGGLDRGPLASVPDFEKSLSVDHATDGEVIVAYLMNDAPLPMLNGFPCRLVVPGWYSTYWVKALDSITVLPGAFDGYWMTRAYRIPKNDGATEQKSAPAKETAPISRMNVRSLLITPGDVSALRRGAPVELGGIAFDGGTGIRKVEVSTDGGATYREAELGADLGKYSWRRWKAKWTPDAAGKVTVRVRATSVGGETQPAEATRWNRAGYMRNAVEPVTVTVVG